MKNFRLLYDNWFDNAATVLTALTAATGFPASNIQHIHHTRHWRSTSHDEQWVKWDFGSPLSVTDLICKYHNFTPNATVKIQAHASDLGDGWADWDAASINLTVSPVTTSLFAYTWTSAQAFRWWRLAVDDPTNSNAYVRIGRIFCGPRYSMVVNISQNYTRELLDPSKLQESIGGQIFASVESRFRSYVFNFEGIPAAEMVQLQTIFEDYVGMHRPYFICIDADNLQTTTMYVLNDRLWPIPHVFNDTYYNITISVKWAR